MPMVLCKDRKRQTFDGAGQRFKPEPVPRMPTRGMKIAAGPIVDTPFEGIEGYEDHKGYLASTHTAFSTALG